MGKCMFLRKGETHTAPLTGILASDLAVGSTVKLMVNGAETDFLVVNQGIPSSSSLYDSSCNGLWLLKKDISETRAWYYSNSNYQKSAIHSYMNGDYFNSFGPIEQEVIKQIKIPHLNGAGASSSTIASGESGLSCKIFLLSGYEVGYTTSTSEYMPKDGARLSYFTSGTTTDANGKRIAYKDGTATAWWTRSANNSATGSVWVVSTSGANGTKGCTSSTSVMGFRPALILPLTSIFDKDTLILKGVV